MADQVLVSEIFGPTFQGEGPSLGLRCGFIRLSTCNLRCVWCDTKYTWDWENYDIKKEMHRMSVDEIVEKILLMDVDRVVFSGGEPMLQQRHIYEIIRQLPKNGWRFEIETAGTIKVEETGVPNNIQFNVSPKLAHSGNPESKRFVPTVLQDFAVRGANFKFVVQQESDLEEVSWIQLHVGIDNSKIFIMPEGTNPKTIEEHARNVADITISRGWNFTTRLHVMLWGDKRGV